MKYLVLEKKEINTKSAKYRYDVVEDGRILCTRKTNRDYVACYVLKDEIRGFSAPNYFGRLDLVGKGDSQMNAISPKLYGLATLKQDNDKLI